MKQFEQTCPICFGSIHSGQTLREWFWNRDCICGKCRSLFDGLNQQVLHKGLKVHVLYQYQDDLENLLYQFKEGRDVALAPIFFHLYTDFIKRHYRGYTMIGMPSSMDKQKERGFHHLKKMIETIPLSYIDLFEKDDRYKQSLKNAAQRSEITQHMRFRTDAMIPSTPLLLVDDVCTTGATMHHAYQLLSNHTMKVEALALCAHKQFLQECTSMNIHQKGFFRRKEKDYDRQSKMV